MFAVQESEFYIDCLDSLIVVNKAEVPVNGTKNCTLHTAATFVGTISFSCDASALTGVDCVAPSDISVESGVEETTVSYIVEATSDVVAGEEGQILALAYAESASNSKSSSFSMLIVSSGGSQMAAYDSQLGAPRCFAGGSDCSSGELLDGRGLVGPEPNSPNSLDECTDGDSGVYREDEHLDAIKVRSGRLDSESGDDIAEGDYITISATVFAYNSNDRADFWHTSNPVNPSWNYIGSIYAEESNSTEVIEVEYILPHGLDQAVRVKFDYQGNVSDCRESNYGDIDDLVFKVKHIPFYIMCPDEVLIIDAAETPLREQRCTIYSSSDYEGSLEIGCTSSELNGVDCTSESPVEILLGTLETNVTITIDVSTSAIAGESGDILVTAVDPGINITKASAIQMLVIQGGGPQTADYDSDLGAPHCFAEGSLVRWVITFRELSTYCQYSHKLLFA